MQPIFSTLIVIDKSLKQPVYLQIANRLMVLVKDGSLQAGYRLPSTRALAWAFTHTPKNGNIGL